MELTIDYTAHRLNIQFPLTIRTGATYNEIKMMFLSIDRPFIGQSILLNIMYTCTLEDDCSRIYVFRHIVSIIAMNYSEIHENLSGMLAKKQNKMFCYDTTRPKEECPGKLCVAEEKENGRLNAACGSDKSDTTEVNMTVYMQKDRSIQERIKYTCKFDQCNGEDMFKTVKDTVRLYHQGLSKFFRSTDELTRPSTIKGQTKLPSRTPPTKKNEGGERETSVLIIIFLFIFLV